ncbi:hypothetical protein LINPERHAP2_LOCUS14522 [Linum perenne]
MQLPYVERLHDPLHLREFGNHRRQPVGERADRDDLGFHDRDDKSFDRGLG